MKCEMHIDAYITITSLKGEMVCEIQLNIFHVT